MYNAHYHQSVGIMKTQNHTCQGVVGDMREMLLIIPNTPPLLVLINYS